MAIPSSHASTASAALNGMSYPVALCALTSLFFLWGFVTSLNDILIPHLKAVFELSYFQAMAVNMAFFGAYALVSYPASLHVRRHGYQTGLVTGLLVAGTGALLFAWTSSHLSYGLTLTALFVLASGITLLQVAANPYVIHLGKAEQASTRLTMTQAFNSLGTTLAPALGAALILSQLEPATADLTAAQLVDLNLEKAARVQWPYLVLTALLFGLALIFSRLKLPQITQDTKAQPAKLRSLLQQRHLTLGVLAIFAYVGAEVGIGSFMVNYFAEPAIGAMTEHQAASFVSWYWGGALLGRFIGIPLLNRIAPASILTFNALAAVICLLISINSAGLLAVYSLVLVGLFNSIMFPTIFSLALQKLGALSSQGSGLLCIAIVGGAILPMLQGLLADHIGIQLAFVLPLLCYLYIAGYGRAGYKIREH